MEDLVYSTSEDAEGMAAQAADASFFYWIGIYSKNFFFAVGGNIESIISVHYNERLVSERFV